MPFQSKAQQRWMFANKPKMAKRWAKHTKDIKSLPEKAASFDALASTFIMHVKAAEDKIPGGLADNKPDAKYNKTELAEGVDVEKEHTGDPAKAKEIAKDHLEEIADYYTRLNKMESQAEQEKKASIQKVAFISALLGALGKHGFRRLAPWIAKRLGAKASGSLISGVKGVGRNIERGSKWLGRKPLLEDTMLGGAFLPLTKSEDESYLEAGMRDIPLTIGMGALFRAGEKAVTPAMDKIKSLFSKKSAAIDPNSRLWLLRTVTDFLNKRTILEHAILGGGVGAATTPMSEKSLPENIARGGMVGAGVGGGALAGDLASKKILSKATSPIVKKLFTVPSATAAGAAIGGLAANQIYKLLSKKVNTKAASCKPDVSVLYAKLNSINQTLSDRKGH